ncbi:MAG: tyrosine-type recombinase/integrase [Steroidobacteraceae bacterium]
MRHWDRLVEGYLEEYRARGICQATVAHTGARLADWGCWLKSRRPRPQLEAIDTELHVRYIESRSAFRAKATVYGTLSTMRGFGEYLLRQGVWTQNPLRWMKGPKITPYSRLPRRIDRAHMEALWTEAAKRRGNFSRHLWIAVLALLYGTGLRRGELERLDIEHFDRAEGLLRIDGRKSGRERCVPVSEFVFRCLEAYWPQRHNQLERSGRLSERALLVSQRGERLSAQAISNGIHALAERAGVPLVSVHQFRHSCASDLLEAGVHLAEVQRILGHQGIATTVRYTHIADPQRHAAMALHPINHWLAESRATVGKELAA